VSAETDQDCLAIRIYVIAICHGAGIVSQCP
jgi:hypothetical protein